MPKKSVTTPRTSPQTVGTAPVVPQAPATLASRLTRAVIADIVGSGVVMTVLAVIAAVFAVLSYEVARHPDQMTPAGAAQPTPGYPDIPVRAPAGRCPSPNGRWIDHDAIRGDLA